MSEDENETPKRLTVRVVGKQAGSVLVEWLEAGAYKRAYVPAAAIKDGTASLTALHRGIPYGIAWEKYITVTATAESIANELRRRGIWRWQDINNEAIQAANQAMDLGEFLRRVRQEVKGK